MTSVLALEEAAKEKEDQKQDQEGMHAHKTFPNLRVLSLEQQLLLCITLIRQ